MTFEWEDNNGKVLKHMTDNLVDFISKDVQEYMAENGLEFKDFEKAALIYNSDLTVNERNARLEALAESSADETLKAQIAERLRVDREDIEAFYNNTEGFIYKADVYDPEYGSEPDTIGYFKTAELAYKYAKKRSFKFEIEKHWIIGDNVRPLKSKDYFNPHVFTDESEEELLVEEEGESEEYGGFMFNKNGELIYFWSGEIDRGFKESTKLNYGGSRFENAFIAVPNPFELGDIVRYIGGDESGIVNTSRKENDERVEKALSGEWGAVDFFDSGITVDFLKKNGHFAHDHINPAFLEKHEPQKGDEDYNLLMAASAVCKGECTLDWFTMCYDNYKEKNGKKE